MDRTTYQKWDDVPEGLATKTTLKRMGKKPAKDQEIVAYKRNYNRGPNYALYEISEAVERKPASEAQLAALEKARKQAELNSRCARCNIPFSMINRGIYKIEDVENGPYICFVCHDHDRAAEWAREFLATPNALIFDTETTGLGTSDEIVEIAIVNTAGVTVFDSLVRPTIAIPMEASAIHGITDDDVSGAPTWADIDWQVFDLIRNAPAVGVYNLDYDLRLVYQSRAAHNLADHDRKDIWWVGGKPKSRCVMKIYAKWFGEWSDYHGSYTWQKLDGGHRALGDCLATLECIKEMANS